VSRKLVKKELEVETPAPVLSPEGVKLLVAADLQDPALRGRIGANPPA